MESEPMLNREYKDRLFKLLFGREDNKKDLLNLYNGLAGTSYTEADDLELVTIDDVIYLSMKNDVSFILDSVLSLFEQQSSFNPNMPIRGLMYFAKSYDAIIKVNGQKIYGRRLIKIPTPQYYVFYNGNEKHGDREILRLSDAFVKKPISGEYEWTATMININKGHNNELMAKCQSLRDYSDFVEFVREQMVCSGDVNKAVRLAIDKFKNGNGTLAMFLAKNEAEVFDVCITEYNEQEVMRGLREEALEDGREEGREEGRTEGIIGAISLLKSVGQNAAQIKAMIMNQFSLTDAAADQYLKRA